MAVVGDKYVWKSGDGLWYIWEQMPGGYPPIKGDTPYHSKRKARIDARGALSTSRHPTEEEIAEGVTRRKRDFLPHEDTISPEGLPHVPAPEALPAPPVTDVHESARARRRRQRFRGSRA